MRLSPEEGYLGGASHICSDFIDFIRLFHS